MVAALAGSMLGACSRPSTPAVSRISQAAPAARAMPTAAPGIAADEIRALRAELARTAAERDDAVAQLHAALARERALRARLKPATVYIPPPARLPAHAAAPARAPQVFDSVSTEAVATP